MPEQAPDKNKARHPNVNTQDKSKVQVAAINTLDTDELGVPGLAEAQQEFEAVWGRFKHSMPDFYAYQMGTRVT
jgi:hypothetical protein